MTVSPHATGKVVLHQPYSAAVVSSAGIWTASSSSTTSVVSTTLLNTPEQTQSWNVDTIKSQWTSRPDGMPQHVVAPNLVSSSARRIDASSVVSPIVSVMGASWSNSTTQVFKCVVSGFTQVGVVWQYHLDNCEGVFDGDNKDVALSDDGSTAAVLVYNMTFTTKGAPAKLTPQVHVLNATNGHPIFIYDAPKEQGAGLRDVTLSRRGEYLSFVNNRTLSVLDVSKRALRGPAITMPMPAPAHLCPMGLFLIFGYKDAHVLMWNESSGTYESKFTVSGGNFRVNAITTSVNGGGSKRYGCLLALGWYRSDGLQAKLDMYAMVSEEHFWSWTSPANAQVQDNVAQISMHLGYASVAVWGDRNATTPQLYLFHASSSTPVFTHTSPGSMLTTDVYVAPSSTSATCDTVYIAAGGKHIQANVLGYGGDYYAFVVQNCDPNRS